MSPYIALRVLFPDAGPLISRVALLLPDPQLRRLLKACQHHMLCSLLGCTSDWLVEASAALIAWVVQVLPSSIAAATQPF